MGTRRTTPQMGARHFGMTAPYALPGAAAAPESPPSFETEMAKAIRQATMERQARMAGVPMPGLESQHAAPPQVATVQDQIALSQEARSSAKDVAELARQQAEEARAELERVKAQAGGAYEAGKQETLDLWERLDARDQRHQERLDALEAQLREANDARRDSESAKAIAELKAQMEADKKERDQLIAQLKKEADEAKAKAVEATRPKSGPEQALDLIKAGEDPNSPRVQVLLYGKLPNPGQQSLNEKWEHVQLEAHIDEFMAEIEAKRAKRQREQERQGKMDGAVDHIVENAGKLTDLLRGAAEQFLGVGDAAGQGSKAGLPHNGFPGTLDGMAAMAEQAMGGGAQ